MQMSPDDRLTSPLPYRPVADVLREANRTADWSTLRGLYRQIIDMLPDQPPEDLLAGPARVVFDLAPTYAGRLQDLVEHTLAVIADEEGYERFDPDLHRRLYQDSRFASPGPQSWRRPPFFQAVVETCRRLRDAGTLRRSLSGTATAGIICGSASYGAFFNVRGADGDRPGSDLDVVVVVDRSHDLCAIGERVAELPGVPAADAERFARRARIFASTYDDGRTAFSHKIALWADGVADPMLPNGNTSPQYLLSLHIVTLPALRYVLVDSATRLSIDAAGSTRTLRDYRDSSTDRRDEHRTFAGRRHLMDLSIEPADEGYLRQTRIYYVDGTGAYCPGFIQSLLLLRPRSELDWDGLDVRPELDAFRHKLRERLRLERSRNPHALLRISFAHVRRAAFAPHVRRLIDGDN